MKPVIATRGTMTLRIFPVLIPSQRRTVLLLNTDANTLSPIKLIASMNPDIDAEQLRVCFANKKFGF